MRTDISIDLQAWPVRDVLDTLLRDKSTGGYIIWASGSYGQLGPGFDPLDEITPDRVTGMNRDLIQPRVLKARAEQAARTRQHAEVFTPAWICRKMCDVFDEQFAALPPEEYIRTRVLEITCGEAPFLTGRYDSATGEAVPPEERYGLFDRKLRAVNVAAQTEKDWLRLAKTALQSTYGYEFQGDSLLIARVNLLCAWCEALRLRWGREPNRTELQSAANTIAWNLWQMDGLKGTRPLSGAGIDFGQMSLFEDEPAAEPPVRIYDYRGKHSVNFTELREGVSGMKFDFVIGNPPYQVEAPGTSTSDKPIYNYFMDESYDVSDKVLLITPGRFLFNAGATPSAWNQKMLSDEHLRVEYYEQNSSVVFANTDIKGGVAITYRDLTKSFGEIGTFTVFPELNSLLAKVRHDIYQGHTLDTIIYTQNKFNLSELNAAIPGLNRTDRRLESNIFALPIFTEDKCSDSDYKIIGLIKNKRVYRWVDKKFLDITDTNLLKYKVIVPKSNGSGSLGEVLSTPMIGTPMIGYTRTFIGIGAFDTAFEGDAAMKYVKSKFCRTMLGILKITQDNNPEKWRLVPLQDFTPSSDIDWSQSIPDIDRQLYRKYGLSAEEIDFIETHVKEMT